ncbi:glycosyltransferase family 2 protein [Thalassoglobus sp.]|uniref:glycosyltransferase family 2 protein n=1 Tax=Thalassoglobus sp. TaxID=2795869 RepID=UPI003AA9CA7D
MKTYQILIKSFRRFDALERCVDSIVQYYPDASIVIADDSFELIPGRIPRTVQRLQGMRQVQWVQMPFDSGLSAGRNRMVELADSERLILFDDDFVVNEETQLENLLKLLDVSDLAAGVLRDRGKLLGVPGVFSICDGELTITSTNSQWSEYEGISYRKTDMALNFFAARKCTLLKHPWDTRFKITGEHLDFFLSLWKAGIRVVTTPDSIIKHERSHSADYLKYRCRQAAFRPLVAQKWGLKRLPIYSPYIEELT